MVNKRIKVQDNSSGLLCTVVHGATLKVFLANFKITQKHAQMVELRADSIQNFKLKDIKTLKENTKVPSIFTFRHKKEGGLFKGNVAKQRKVLEKAFEIGFSYVDVAYTRSVIKKLNNLDEKRLLLSWHNINETPSAAMLINILDGMRTWKPAIMKIACCVTDWEDLASLSALLKEKKSKEKLIVIGMGEMGKSTRIMFPSMGSYISYVPMKGERKIPPGMLTEKQLKPYLRT